MHSTGMTLDVGWLNLRGDLLTESTASGKASAMPPSMLT
jgi:hypothetical protein